MPRNSKSRPKHAEDQNVDKPSEISSLTSNLSKSSRSLPRLGYPTTFNVHRDGEHSAFCRWQISNFPKARTKNRLFSPYIGVGGLYFRLGMVPEGFGGSIPGYLSFFIELDEARCLKSDFLVDFKVTLRNHLDDSQSLHVISHRRFPVQEKFIFWRDFAVLSTVLDPKSGFLSNQSVHVIAQVCVLDETLTFSVDDGAKESVSSSSDGVYVGKYSWRIRNFSLFKERTETQRITSPALRIVLCDYRLTTDRILINGVRYLSLYLESDIKLPKAIKRQRIDARKKEPRESCWGLYEIWVLNQKPWLEHMHRKTTGRFSCDNKYYGWRGYMKMSDFIGSQKGFLADDGTVVFCVSFHVVKESFFSKHGPGNPTPCALSKCDKDISTFHWEIQNFSFLKNIMKKTMTNIRIESMEMKVENLSFLLAVYPRGQFHRLGDLALVLESINSTSNSPDWSALVHCGFGIMNQKASDRSFVKESIRRCCRDTTEVDSEFITVNGLFDEDCGYISREAAIFFAQIYILKETIGVQDWICTWKVENFLEFKEILVNQEVQSKFFKVAECQFRFGVFISSHSVDIYLDNDPSLASDSDDVLWVRFRVALWNQKYPTRNLWKESCLLTNNYNCNGFLSMKLSDILEPDSGYVVDNMISFVCQILDYCPWFDFSDPEVLCCDEDRVLSSSGYNKPLKSKGTDLNVARKVDIFTNLISRVPFAATSQSEFENNFWELVFSQILAQMVASNNETLGIIIHRLFRTASQCQHNPQAVKAIHVRLEELGTAVPISVLNLSSETITIWNEIAEAMLRKIYYVFNLHDRRKRILQLTACQQRVHYVDVNLQEEMSENAPLYGI